MVETIAFELVKGIGSLFMQPLFYLLLFFSLFLGISRVKRERKDFNIRIYDTIDDVYPPLVAGLLFGAVLSIITLVVGLVMPSGIIVLLTAAYVLLSLTLQIRFMSPAIVVGVVVIVASLIGEVTTGQDWLNQLINDIHNASLSSLVILLGLAIIVESILIIKKGSINTSPRLFMSRRGKIVGVHESKKLWMVPAFFLLPNGAITEIGWWPIFSLGEQIGYSLVLMPIGIGFHQLVRSNLPKNVINKSGRAVLLLGILITGLAVASVYFPIMISIVAGVAIIGRITIMYLYHKREENAPNYFSDRAEGAVILGVIPQSPAAKMNLKAGEVIRKVNGQPLTNKADFYHALQLNSAFCKLEVLDEKGEIRFAQTALYDGEHHQIGVVFVQEKKEFQEEQEVI